MAISRGKGCSCRVRIIALVKDTLDLITSQGLPMSREFKYLSSILEKVHPPASERMKEGILRTLFLSLVPRGYQASRLVLKGPLLRDTRTRGFLSKNTHTWVFSLELPCVNTGSNQKARGARSRKLNSSNGLHLSDISYLWG